MTGTVRAVTRPILPSADLEVTAAFYASLGFVKRGHWIEEYLIVPEPAVLNPPSATGHLVEFQLIDVHGNLVRVGAPNDTDA